MKKNIKNGLALYPTPLVVVGAMVDGKPNYMLAGHVGIIGHDRIMVSLAKPHYTNKGIKATGALTVSIVDKQMLKKADYTGCVSGNSIDKSELFAFHQGKTGAPIVEEAPVVMECTVDDIYETEGFESFICKIAEVYADEAVLNEDEKIDYNKLKPILFEMPTYEYVASGEVIGKCMTFGKEMKGNE